MFERETSGIRKEPMWPTLTTTRNCRPSEQEADAIELETWFYQHKGVRHTRVSTEQSCLALIATLVTHGCVLKNRWLRDEVRTFRRMVLCNINDSWKIRNILPRGSHTCASGVSMLRDRARVDHMRLFSAFARHHLTTYATRVPRT
jgi:hypothetical protein